MGGAYPWALPFGNIFFGKPDIPGFSPLFLHLATAKTVTKQAITRLTRIRPFEACWQDTIAIMTPRLAALATLSREVALPAVVLVCIAASGFTATGTTRAVPPIALAAADTTAAKPVMEPAPSPATAEVNVAAPEPQPIVTAALNNSSEMMPPVQPLDAATSAAGEGTGNATPPAASTDASADCLAATAPADAAANTAPEAPAGTPSPACTDGFLWTLYQRAPKQDSVSNRERRTVTVKRKGKMVTVTRIVSAAAEEDFSWKDPKAAEKPAWR